jgi:hypothetical protein
MPMYGLNAKTDVFYTNRGKGLDALNDFPVRKAG